MYKINIVKICGDQITRSEDYCDSHSTAIEKILALTTSCTNGYWHDEYDFMSYVGVFENTLYSIIAVNVDREGLY